jgi:hypothetical protein
MHKVAMSVDIRNAQEKHERASMQTGHMSPSFEERIKGEGGLGEKVRKEKRVGGNEKDWGGKKGKGRLHK